ncbi:hypothetical protein NPIL_10592 [Nephila pilipes]|uniref:Uncharacterized protein n=1 Tax=Nephila pilipes TaxID=299642 RepID=A0A8X6P2G6_NEPPI|nr:hypothetical protein NPIL_10592 [Nephila pilipes]
MVSLHTQILCISIALFALTLEGYDAQSSQIALPPGQDVSDLDMGKANLHNGGAHPHGNSTGGKNVHTYRYKLPGKETNHTYRYKLPGKTNNHTYRYKLPGKVNHHTYRYKLPGKTVSHTYRYKVPGMKKPQPVTGVYYLINLMYNYFAVGGHLTGIAPVDLLLLRYYVAEGPRTFCECLSKLKSYAF